LRDASDAPHFLCYAPLCTNIAVQKEIVLVPVVEYDNTNKLIGVVARLDILREKLNEGFITIEKREALSRT
jgi:predicted transcriptional regulator